MLLTVGSSCKRTAPDDFTGPLPAFSNTFVPLSTTIFAASSGVFAKL
jgi:hypothetical protein